MHCVYDENTTRCCPSLLGKSTPCLYSSCVCVSQKKNNYHYLKSISKETYYSSKTFNYIPFYSKNHKKAEYMHDLYKLNTLICKTKEKKDQVLRNLIILHLFNKLVRRLIQAFQELMLCSILQHSNTALKILQYLKLN